MAAANSFSYALEDSMKIWQLVYGRSTQPVHNSTSSRSATEQRMQATASRLSAALDFSRSLGMASNPFGSPMASVFAMTELYMYSQKLFVG